MTMKEIYEEIMSNMGYDMYELFDDWDENSDRITVLNESENIIVNVEFTDEKTTYAGNAIIDSEEFKNFTCDGFIKLVNEVRYYAQPTC